MASRSKSHSILAALWLVALLCVCTGVLAERSFVFDPQCKCFRKDGQPFRYVSGSLHYFRVPQSYWSDRMQKMRAMGLNVLETYVEWSTHEPEPGEFTFAGGADLAAFLKMAQDSGFDVILRPGPFICAERDMGGLPYWLLSFHPDMALRTSDPRYLRYVDRWFTRLLSYIEPFLYENGGPIIMIQVENEYGQIPACDFVYLSHLRDMIRSFVGERVPLFLTNIPIPNILRCDNLDGTLLTLDFGSYTNVTKAFSVLRSIKENVPLVVTEYYPGWLDHWSQPHANVSTQGITQKLDEILSAGASVNLYMAHGGTNFGYSSGANIPYWPQPTSYDYTSPISEAGDLTPRFYAIRKVIQRHFPFRPIPVPHVSRKISLGPFPMIATAGLFDWPKALPLPDAVQSKAPLSFEALRQAHGFCLYSTKVDWQVSDPVSLKVPDLHDRGYVFVDHATAGVLSRQDKMTVTTLSILPGQNLHILVENQGRINSAPNLTDFKGLGATVLLGNRQLANWTMQPLPMNDTAAIHGARGASPPSEPPALFTTTFDVPPSLRREETIPDTFLDTRGWGKGVAFLNDRILGRYWPLAGPQLTLYVPGVWLRPRSNRLTLLELEAAPSSCWNQPSPGPECAISFIDHPILDGPTPQN